MLAQAKQKPNEGAAAAVEDARLDLITVLQAHHRVLVIMRGPPGSHKSSVAAHFIETIPNTVSCSADNYFVKPDGEYEWYPKGLGKAHENCRMLCEKHMRDSKECIIIDNTNIKNKDYDDYLKLAKKHNYFVVQCVPDGRDDSIHEVPKDKIEQMRTGLEANDKIPQIKIPDTKPYDKERLKKLAFDAATKDRDILNSLPKGAATASTAHHRFHPQKRHPRGKGQHQTHFGPKGF